ncbi:MAG: sialidase family protein, partial [Candidatus Latescibacterota bacterium]
MERLRFDDGSRWCFLNGQWQDGPHGELIPPDGGGKEYVAVCRDRVFTDLTARFRFLFRGWYGGVRLLFRLQDMGRYYALDVPWGGQQNRNRHFWAGLVKADGTPLQRYLHLGLVPGVCPEHGRWYEARLECRGSRIRAWIEGRLAFDVVDLTLAAGRVGLMAEVTAVNDSAHFADLEVEGAPFGASAGFEPSPPAPHWITPCPTVDPEAYQSYPTLIQGDSGHLALQIPFGNPNAGQVSRAVVVRSEDGGRAWSTPEPATLPQGFGAPFARRDGTWVCVHGRDQVPVDQAIYAVESADQGRTWTEPRSLTVRGPWPPAFSLPAYPSGRP